MASTENPDAHRRVNRRRFLIVGAAGAVSLTAGDALSTFVPRATASATTAQSDLSSSRSRDRCKMGRRYRASRSPQISST